MSEETSGFVSLVGAGPGDPGLITVAGLERIRRADVIVYDRLIPASLLDHARERAELIYVGKTPEGERSRGITAVSTDQEAINRTLLEEARKGKRVVRLKGGDPFVFGRGGEEAEALREAGIAFEVVPGITSAVAVPAYAGIPVTHRGVASSFAAVTGHEDPSKDETSIEWDGLARVDTLVLLMGVRTLPRIVDKLIAAGRSPETPVAVIQQGTTPEQRTITGTLADIAQRVEEAGIAPPAITVVGEVVRLRDAVTWFEQGVRRLTGERPLFGKRVLITRTRKQASALADLLSAEGAIPVELPSIEIQPVEDRSELAAAIDALAEGRYDWAVFTSANAVDVFFEALRERGFDARAFVSASVAAIGPATADALSGRGIMADVVPEEYVAERVVEALRPYVAGEGAPSSARSFDKLRTSGKEGSAVVRILIPRAAEARPELPDGLRALGAEVDEVPLYRAVVPQDPPPEPLRMLRAGEIDVATFTSSSTVRNLVSMLDSDVSLLSSRPSPSSADERRDLSRSEVAQAIATRDTEASRAGESRPLIACIGPITAQTAEELGLTVDVVAEEYTVPGLVRALRGYLSSSADARAG